MPEHLWVYREGPLDSGSRKATKLYNYYFHVLGKPTQFMSLCAGRILIRVAAVNYAPGRLAQRLFKMGSAPYYGPDESPYDIFLERTFLAGDLLSGVGYGECYYGMSENVGKNLTYTRIQVFNWFYTHHVHYFCGMCANREGDSRFSFLDTLPFSSSSRPSSPPYKLVRYRLSTSTIGTTLVDHGPIFLRHSTFPSTSYFMPRFSS